jgi:hypothetical protein
LLHRFLYIVSPKSLRRRSKRRLPKKEPTEPVSGIISLEVSSSFIRGPRNPKVRIPVEHGLKTGEQPVPNWIHRTVCPVTLPLFKLSASTPKAETRRSFTNT